MKFPVRSRPRPARSPASRASRGVDRRTAHLIARLRPGDLAIIDHQDMDRDTAQALVDADVAAVLNAAPMISGRYPNLGPEVLVQAGIMVVDSAGRSDLRPGQGRHRRPRA